MDAHTVEQVSVITLLPPLDGAGNGEATPFFLNKVILLKSV